MHTISTQDHVNLVKLKFVLQDETNCGRNILPYFTLKDVMCSSNPRYYSSCDVPECKLGAVCWCSTDVRRDICLYYMCQLGCDAIYENLLLHLLPVELVMHISVQLTLH